MWFLWTQSKNMQDSTSWQWKEGKGASSTIRVGTPVGTRGVRRERGRGRSDGITEQNLFSNSVGRGAESVVGVGGNKSANKYIKQIGKS